MEVTEMHAWFDLMEDKVDTVYYTSHEKDSFISRSIQLFVNDLSSKMVSPPTGPTIIFGSVETTLPTGMMLKPLMRPGLVVAAATGLITDVAINAVLNTDFGTSNKVYQAILSIADSAGLPVTYKRHNDFDKQEQNEFKKSSVTNPVYRLQNDGLLLSPADNGNYTISVLKAPDYVDYDAGTNTDLPVITHDIIIAKALALASIGSMDENLARIKQEV
jgi:hypothetical protein